MTSIHCPVGGLYPPLKPFQSAAICSRHHCPCLLTNLCVRSVSWDPMSHQSPPWPLLYWRRSSPPTLSGNFITHSPTWDIHPVTRKDWFTQTHAMGIKFHRCPKHWNLSYGTYGTEPQCCNSLRRLHSAVTVFSYLFEKMLSKSDSIFSFSDLHLRNVRLMLTLPCHFSSSLKMFVFSVADNRSKDRTASCGGLRIKWKEVIWPMWSIIWPR